MKISSRVSRVVYSITVFRVLIAYFEDCKKGFSSKKLFCVPLNDGQSISYLALLQGVKNDCRNQAFLLLT